MRVAFFILGFASVFASAAAFASPVHTAGVSVQTLSPRTLTFPMSFRAVHPDGYEPWISGSAGKGKVAGALRNQCTNNAALSPTASLLAFEIFDCEGHSPLTTRHVWVERANGKGRKEVLLPIPLAIFSTHTGGWVSPGTIRVLAEVPGSPAPVAYFYTYATNSVSAEPQ